MTIWIVGGGIVGRRITRLLDGENPNFHDPRREPTPLTTHGDVAVLTHPVGHGRLAHAFAERNTAVVTVGDETGDTMSLLALDGRFLRSDVPLVIGAGMSPGLSGLLARRLADQMATVDEIHVATHGTAGPACARRHHRSLSGRAVSWRDGQWRYSLGGGGRELCWFPEPVGALDCYHAEGAEPILLHQSFPDVSRIDARRSARRRDRFTARLPMLSPPHPEGAVGALRVEVRGGKRDGARHTALLGIAELVGLAAAATAAAFVLAAQRGELPAGVVLSGDANLDNLGLLRQIERFGVRLQEFTGVPQAS